MKLSLCVAGILLCILGYANGFTFLSKIKVPSLKDFQSSQSTDGKFGSREIVVVTGTSSGLGRKTLKHLLQSNKYHVICGVRDVDKMELVAEEDDLDNLPGGKDNYSIMDLDLASFTSVRNFCDNVNKLKEDRPLDRLVCNAAVYQPSLPDAKWTEDGHEQQLQINYLSHFLMISLMLPELEKADKARVITVGSVTGNDNTVGGGGVYPIADLHNLQGLEAGARNPIAMVDGRDFNGAKAYKDSKLMIMMLTNMLHDRYNRATGVAFSSIYPGCIAASPLFREKRPWFRKYFPVFMKYITGGYVGEEEAGSRLAQAVTDSRCAKSGVYWSWNGGPREGRGVDALKNDGNIVGAGGAGGSADDVFEAPQSDKVHDMEKMNMLWKYSTEVTGAEWVSAKSSISPCPTLRVIGAVTRLIEAKEDLAAEKRIAAVKENKLVF